jgi:DNA-binding transcriptional ArsR family regulator
VPESASTPKKRDRKEATHYALGARIRTAILTILNDGPASHSELAKLTGLSYGAVGHHIKAMMVDGSIELAAILSVRNQNVHVYRAVKRAYTSDEEAEQASPEENNELAAFIIQGFTAEALCALWAGKLDASKRQVKMSWDMFNVDPETRDKIHQEQLESYERIEQLAGEGINNLAESGEKGVPMIVGSFGFDRSRNTRTPYPLEVKAD